MANKSLTDLTARTSTADSDLIHVNSGGTDYKETKIDFLQGSLAKEFSNTSALTSQVDALTVGNYFGTIASYGHQTETGVPANTNYYVNAFVYAGTTYRKILLHTLNSDTFYIRYKYSDGSWGDWVQVPTRAEITNSLKYDELISQLNVPTTATAYSVAWQNYNALLICHVFYSNIYSTRLIPVSYFSTTNNQRYVAVHTPSGDKSWSLYQNGSGSVYIRASGADSTNGVRIYGVGKVS